jgi:ketohexokinase
VSIEVEKPGREGLEELAAEADVIFFSRNWAEVRWWISLEAGRVLFPNALEQNLVG